MWSCGQIKNFKVTAETAVAVKDLPVAAEPTDSSHAAGTPQVNAGVFVSETSGEIKQF